MSVGAEPVRDPDADDHVRRELARLGADADSAPDIPPDVTALVTAALRNAPPTHASSRPKLTRTQWAGLLVGICAAGVAAVVGVLTLTGDPAPTSQTSPTASQITVERTFPLSDDDLRAALTQPLELGTLADAKRRASCLTGLGYAPNLDVLGGRQLEIFGRPGVLMLLPGESPERIDAVMVEPGCSAAHTGLLAETVVSR